MNTKMDSVAITDTTDNQDQHDKALKRLEKFQVWSTRYTDQQKQAIQYKLVKIFSNNGEVKQNSPKVLESLLVLSVSNKEVAIGNIEKGNYYVGWQCILSSWIGKVGESCFMGVLLNILHDIGWKSADDEILQTDWNDILSKNGQLENGLGNR